VGTHAVDLARFIMGDVAQVIGAAATISIPERFLPLGTTTGHGHVALSDQKAKVDNDEVMAALLRFANGAQGFMTALQRQVGHAPAVRLDDHRRVVDPALHLREEQIVSPAAVDGDVLRRGGGCENRGERHGDDLERWPHSVSSWLPGPERPAIALWVSDPLVVRAGSPRNAAVSEPRLR
jgi:hypothetical protein